MTQESVTRMLAQWKAGDDSAFERAMPLIYNELRFLARAYLNSQPPGHTLRPTELAHEFYLRANGLRHVDWQSRGQFIAAAAKVMRNLLVDHARKKHAAKRQVPSARSDPSAVSREHPLDVLEMNRALDKLSEDFPRPAEVVQLIFFGGLNAAEATEVLSACGTAVSQRTVERDWKFARAWLSQRMRLR
ncbi:MAG: RNA polymerase subunit sigma-70 [Acidobacteriia bacterium]|nr:RNA polymerase subunit sigma-70 [Terriglobia bacterium]